MFEHVFAPIRIRDMELKNRIILPAMGTRMAEENGAVTDKLIAYHAARAPWNDLSSLYSLGSHLEAKKDL